MDWPLIAAVVLTALIVIPSAILGAKRYYLKTSASDNADQSARDILKETVAMLRSEIKARDEMWQERRLMDREALEFLRAEYLAFRNKQQLENKVSREFSQAVIKDFRKVKNPNMADHDLDTQIYQTGQGPLDR